MAPDRCPYPLWVGVTGSRRTIQICILALAVPWVLLHGCGSSPADSSEPPPREVTPPVDEVTVTPAAAFLDPGDTLQLTATARTSAGTVISDPGLTWRSLSPSATVNPSGRVVGVESGEVVIEATASNGVRGSASVWVTPVSAILPDSGRYGQVVTLAGSALPQDGAFYFTGVAGDLVQAHVRSRSPSGLELWVPVGARDGPLHLVAGEDSVVTSREFRVTADEDIYSSGEDAFPVPLPFENPSLLARSGEPHRFSFEVTAPTPFSLVLEDRGDPQAETTLRAWLFRKEPGPVTLLSFLMTRELLQGGGMLDEAVYSRTILDPGEYLLLVAAMDVRDPEVEGVRRPFGVRLEDGTRHALPPDPFSPNDFPAEAPLVATPLAPEELHAENGYAMDHYRIDVPVVSTIRAVAESGDPWILMFLFPEGPADVLEAWEVGSVVAETDGVLAAAQLETTVAAGRYTLLVWEWGGHARGYTLDLSATPTEQGPAISPTEHSPRPTPFPLRALFVPGKVGPARTLPGGPQ